MGLLDILKQYADPNSVQSDRVGGHFDEVAQQSNPNDLGNGVAAAFRSDATPPFGQMVGDLFGRSDPQQRAGILNQILQSVGPSVLAGLGGGVLGRVLGGGAAPARRGADDHAGAGVADLARRCRRDRGRTPSSTTARSSTRRASSTPSIRRW